MEVALIQVFLVNVPSKLKHEIPRHLYHSKANSNQNRKSHFSLVWVIDFSIISSCLGKFKVFSFFSFYLKKKRFAAPYCFIHMFYSQESQGILISPWCKNPCRVQQELNQDDFYSCDWKILPSFQVIYYLPTRKI